MEHLIADGEGNYLNLRYVRSILIRRCDSTPSCVCDEQDKWHAVAWLAGDDAHFTFNTEGLPSQAEAQALLDRYVRDSIFGMPVRYVVGMEQDR